MNLQPATHCNTLHRTATHCKTLQHTVTHCNTLQQVADEAGKGSSFCRALLQLIHRKKTPNTDWQSYYSQCYRHNILNVAVIILSTLQLIHRKKTPNTDWQSYYSQCYRHNILNVAVIILSTLQLTGLFCKTSPILVDCFCKRHAEKRC